MRANIFRLSKKKDSVASDIVGMVNRWVESVFCTLPYGEYVVKVEKATNPRSLSQNNLMWMWFAVIAKEWTEISGDIYTKDNVHDIMCGMFLPKIEYATPNGELIDCAVSTSKLTDKEFTEFLNRVQAYIETEWGFRLPLPEDKYFEEWKREYNL